MTYPNMISQSLALGIEGVFVKIILCKVTVNEGEPQECWCPNNFFLNANIYISIISFLFWSKSYTGYLSKHNMGKSHHTYSNEDDGDLDLDNNDESSIKWIDKQEISDGSFLMPEIKTCYQ